MIRNLYWCKNCNVPLLSCTCENCGAKGRKICSDLKPMFPQECKFIEKQTGYHLNATGWQNGYWMRYKTIWHNGERLIRFSAKGTFEIVKVYKNIEVASQSCTLVSPDILYKANKSSLDTLENEAISFIKKTTRQYKGRIPIVSFSGGKDSLVVSSLVRKALRTENVSHMFVNTTIEYPDTLDYVSNFKRDNKDVPLYETSSSHTFFEMCKLLGPPSRINAWCCSVFKAAPITSCINRINGHKGIISFEGIRRKESIRRRNRERIYKNKKISKQISAYPIIDWSDFHVWLYILTNDLEYNSAYDKGFSRVGCMFCPNNTPYNENLIRNHYKKPAKQWENLLIDYAKDNGKDEPYDYVTSGAWKIRVGDISGKIPAYVRKTPCLKNSSAMHFILDKDINNNFNSFIERFKPFGRIKEFHDDVSDGFIVYEGKSDLSIFMVKRVKDIQKLRDESAIDPDTKLGSEFLCVDLLTAKKQKYILRCIERQLRKYQACVLCGACEGVCPSNAIHVGEQFKIEANKCNHCLRCVTTKYLRDSCVALHVGQQTTRLRKKELITKM